MDKEKVRQQILKLRLDDDKKTHSLCLQLLEYIKMNPDSYSEAFAYTYLGDYYIGQSDTKKAFDNLFKAKSLIESGEKWNELLSTIHSFLGIAFEIDGNEQSAIQHYLDGYSIAKQQNAIYLECINLNNLAVIFYRHGHFDKALEYFLKAYQLQKDLSYFPSRSTIACNIGDLYLQINSKEKAKKYYEECEEIQTNPILKDLYYQRNQCCYLAYNQEKKQSEYWAEKILSNQETINKYYGFDAFDNYHMLCTVMFKVKSKKYIYQFLQLMEKICQKNTRQLQIVEQVKLKYILMYESKEKQSLAYKKYYKKTQALKVMINQDIAKSMKDKMYLKKVLEQKKELKIQHRNLEKEANIDEVTGIYSRRYYEVLVQKYNQMSKKNIGIIMLDIDYFKEYNDFYGHGDGDKALYSVGDCLKKHAKDNILPCRYGGDEFVCFCEDMSIEEMESYINDIRKELYNQNIAHTQSPCSDRLTLSIGYEIGNMSNLSVYDLLRMADEALYESKSLGRNTYRKRERD